MGRALLAVLALTATSSGCYDLQVTNPNAPDREAVYADAATVEAQVGGAFRQWFEATYAYAGISLTLSAVSFQHASSSACGGRVRDSALPRPAIPSSESCGHFGHPWHALYGALFAVADGLRVLEAKPALAAELGAEREARLWAFGRFVQGVSLGSLALLYDQAVVIDETTRPEDPPPLLRYRAVLNAALAALEDAAALAEEGSWPAIPAEWMSVAVEPAELARLSRSYAARYRAAAARTPEERERVDWERVVADVDAGASSWVMDMDWERGWHNQFLDYGSFPGWAQASYFLLGMADQSGSYQRWLSLPVTERVPAPDADGDGVADPILIVTPDTRFPRGATVAEQEANPGSLFVIPCRADRGDAPAPPACASSDWSIQAMWRRPENGTWRWSYYWHRNTMPYWTGEETRWPEITAAEMRLLKAEGLLRLGDAAGAAALVNDSRTAHGLSPTDATGINVECVPRLPDGACGDLLEMLKWEKRLETHYTGLFGAPWYFDGRGWGDLYRGTFLQVPIPCPELRRISLDAECYSFGGADGNLGARGSVYAWPGEM